MASHSDFRADVAYHSLMSGTSYGHALYKAVLNKNLKPGTIGMCLYFNGQNVYWL